MPMTFYDRTGRAFAYTEDDVHIFQFTGHPAGYIAEGSVYSFAGRHLGTLRMGWLRGHDGARILFTDEAADSPEMPEKRPKPPKLLKKPKPAKGRREPAPPRAEDGGAWSELAPETFFKA